MALSAPLAQVPHDQGYAPDPPSLKYRGRPDAWIEQVDDWYEKAAAAKRAQMHHWILNWLFLRGGRGQWHYRLPSQSGPRIAYNIDGENQRFTINKFPRVRAKLVGKLIRNKPIPEAVAVTASPRDLKAQKVASAIFRNGFVDKWDWPIIWRQLWEEVIKSGWAFVKVEWDPEAMDYIQIVTGNPEIDQNAPVVKLAQTGDLSFSVGTPFELFPDPICRDITLGSARYVQHAKPVPIEMVESEFSPKDIDKVAAGQDWKGDWQYYMRLMRGDDRIDGASIKDLSDQVLLKETWVMPRPWCPSGCFVTTAGTEVLDVRPWPIEKLNEYPFFVFRYDEMPGAFGGATPLSDLRAPQAIENLATTKHVRNLIDFGDQYIAMSAQSETDPEQFDDKHKVIWIDADAPAPSFVAPQPMGAHYIPFFQKSEMDFREISGVHEVSNGQVPNGVTAGKAIDSLIEQDDVQLIAISYEAEHQVTRIGRMALALCGQYYTDNRLVSERFATGTDPGEYVAFRRGDLEGATIVRVDPGSMLAMGRAARLQLVSWAAEHNLLPPPPFGLDLLRRIAGMGDASGVIDEILEAWTNEAVQLLQQQGVDARKAAAEAENKVSITYNDLPPDGKLQAAEKAGIHLDPKMLLNFEEERAQKDPAEMLATKPGQATRPIARQGDT